MCVQVGLLVYGIRTDVLMLIDKRVPFLCNLVRLNEGTILIVKIDFVSLFQVFGLLRYDFRSDSVNPGASTACSK